MKGTVNGSPTAVLGRAAGGQRRPRFLRDKLQVPVQSFAVLRRDRVSRLLDGATRHRVTLVCAPAGAGKTVACADWAAIGAVSNRVAWLTLDAGDRHDWFWGYVGAALSRVPAVPGPAMKSLADTSPERFPLRLVEAAQGFSQPLVLVLDDVHEVTDQRVLAGLDVLIRHAPAGLRLVMLARRPPALQLARLRVAGELADIRGPDLACTADEADAYFALLGMRVAAAERNEVLRRTEGWMAGLRLAAMRAGRAGEGCVTALAGDEPLVTDYLWDEVLARQEPGTRDFLVRTSICEELSGELADALTGGSGGGSLLSRLSRDNSFVTGPSGDAGTYRYHPLLREVLTAQLHRELGSEVPGLLGRAARWYAAAGRPLDAVRCAAAAGDPGLAGLVLAEAGAGAVLAAGPAELEAALALLAPDLTDGDTAVAAAWAIARLWSGDRSGAAGYLEHAVRALGRADPARRRIMAPTLAALQIMSAAGHDHGGDRAAAPRQGAAGTGAQAVTSAEHRAAGLLWFARGVTSLGRWEPAGARGELWHADRHLGAGGLTVLQARARAWRALALASCGELGAAAQAAAEARQLASPAAPGTSSLAALACAQVSLARDDLLAARQLLDEAERCPPGQVPGEPPAAAIGQLLRAKILLADGDPAARSVLSRLRETCGLTCPSLLPAVTVAEAGVALRSGDTGRARALLQLAGGAGTPRGDVILAEGGLRLACSEFDAAIEAVAPYLEQPGHAGRGDGTPAERAGALLVAAAARRRLGDAPGAAALLETALGIAAPEEAYRLFLDGGGCVRSAVTLLVPPTSRHAGFAGRILERFDTQAPRVASTGGTRGARLTDSERAVLCFLPSHMTNEEISQALFLSVNTVKTHLRAAYRKLGVRSRREAIAQGRRLGLL